MFVFGCYTRREDAEKVLGFEWPDFDKTSIQSSDSCCLIVFVRGSKVVHWYEQPRTVETGGLANQEGYRSSEAKFCIVRTGDRWQLEPMNATGP